MEEIAFKLFQVNILQIVIIFLARLLFGLDLAVLISFFIIAVADPKQALSLYLDLSCPVQWSHCSPGFLHGKIRQGKLIIQFFSLLHD